MQDMAGVLTAAKNSDMVKALGAGSAARQAMDAAANASDLATATAALAAAFDTIKASFLATHPHLAHAVGVHQANATAGT